MNPVCKDCSRSESKSWYCKRTQCKLCYQKARYASKRLEILADKKLYYLEHKEEKLAYSRTNSKRTLEHSKNRYKTDINFKLRVALRSRLWHALKKSTKIGSAIDELGCSIDQLKVYIESQFQPGMSWNNHALEGWHIDHIKPLYTFDLSDPVQFKEACHHTNLRPLWKDDNYRNR